MLTPTSLKGGYGMSMINWSEWYQFNQQLINIHVPDSPGCYEIRTDYIFGRLKGYSRTVYIGSTENLKQRLGNRLNDPDKNRTLEEKRLIKKGHTFQFRYAKMLGESVENQDKIEIQMKNKALTEYVTEYCELPPCNRVFPKKVQNALMQEWKL